MSSIAQAVASLRRGELVVFPTETVYGVGCLAANDEAVRRLFAAKERPLGQPLTVHLGPSVDPGAWGVLDARAQALIDRFWPGPLSVVVPRRPGVSDVVTGGHDTVGLRMPAHPLAMQLLDAVGEGLVATSANRHGRPSPTTAAQATDELGARVAHVLDGGPCVGGLESTVLSLVGAPVILRLGALDAGVLAEALGGPVRVAARNPAHPSATRREFRLGVEVRVIAEGTAPSGAVVLSRRLAPVAHPSWRRLPNEPGPWVASFYEALRGLEAEGVSLVLVEQLPLGQEWAAARQRLKRTHAHE